MGLAASQARLLTITSRKADCEFQSMTLSHQKLSLSRDMEAVSTAYQNALNLTKLVYDYQGQNSAELDLSYGLLMTPSIYNDYYPKLVTDNKNRVILNGALATAARAAGIPAEGLLGTPSSDVRNRFIQALATTNIISPSTAASIQSVPYKNTLGLGNTISVSATTEDLSYNDLLNRVKAVATDTTQDYGMELGGNETDTYKRSDDKNRCSQEELYINGVRVKKAEEWSNQGDNGSKVPPEGSGYAVSLYDLLTSEVVLHYDTCKSAQTPVIELAQMQKEIAGTGGVLDWMYDQFAAVLGGANKNDTALQYAYNQLFDLIMPNKDLQELGTACNNSNYTRSNYDEITQYNDNNKKDNEGGDGIFNDIYTRVDMVGTLVEWGDVRGNDVRKHANNYLGFVFSAKNKDSGNDGKDHTAASINISNLADAFLTSYVQYMQDVDKSEYNWDKGAISSSNLFNGNTDKDFVFTVPSEAEIDNGDSDMNAAFYDTMFNMICTKGWVENAQIDSKEYMGEMLKNGMAYISSISDDGFYYQSVYSNEKLVREVADDEAIARAEAQYNTEKTRIENKEQTLDLKMKNLDTEISSLTQEYETVKSLVTKSVEKSFKRYEA